MNHSHPEPAGLDDGGVFTPLPSKFMDGVVTCQFALSNFASKTVKQPNALRPLSQSEKYYPLFAVGTVNATTGKSFIKKNVLRNFKCLMQIFLECNLKNN